MSLAQLDSFKMREPQATLIKILIAIPRLAASELHLMRPWGLGPGRVRSDMSQHVSTVIL
jgi:hypothetical protein